MKSISNPTLLRKLKLYTHLLKRSNNAGKRKRLLEKVITLLRQLEMSLDHLSFQRMIKLFSLASIGFLPLKAEAQSTVFKNLEIDPFGLNPELPEGTDFRAPMIGDLDNDGDLDILEFHLILDYNYYGYISDYAFFENVENPDSLEFQKSSLDIPGINQITDNFSLIGSLGDLDGDGDLDILGTSYDLYTYELGFVFIENTGSISSPAFQNVPLILPLNDTYPSIQNGLVSELADIDGDGDLDLFVSVYDDETYLSSIFFLENIGNTTQSNFATPEESPFGFDDQELITYPDLSLEDFDQDGDLDLLFLEDYSFDVYFSENSGTPNQPNFELPQLISNLSPLTEATLFHDFMDTDEDGDLDLIIYSYGGQVVYSPNELILSIESSSHSGLIIKPNPTKDFIFIETQFQNWEFLVYSPDGRLVLQSDQTHNAINLENLPSGSYIGHFKSDEEVKTIKIIKQE